MILELDKINCEELLEAGGKARNLHFMLKLGCSVPPAYLIPDSVFSKFLGQNDIDINPIRNIIAESSTATLTEMARNIRDKVLSSTLDPVLRKKTDETLKLILEQGFESLVVRSSGQMEDSIAASFAGQYETILNIRTPDRLEDAILKCWASAFSDNLIHYYRDHSLNSQEIRMGIIIQSFVNAEASGVLFTVDPMTGDETTMVIEAVHGLGESLVRGSVNPDIYYYDWYNKTLEIKSSGKQENGLYPLKTGGTEWRNTCNSGQVLSEDQIKELVKLALKIQQYYGNPQDIEWAFEDGKLWLLQTRPITRINIKTEYAWTNADFKDGGISSNIPTPFMWSLYDFIWEKSMPAYLKKVHIHPENTPEAWGKCFFGYPYWNLTAVKEGAKRVPGFCERNFDEDLGICPAYEGPGFQKTFTILSLVEGVRILLALKKSFKSRTLKNRLTIDRVANLWEAFIQKDLALLHDKELHEYAANLIHEEYRDMETAYFHTIYDTSNASTLFNEAFKKFNNRQKTRLNLHYLLSGLENLSHLNPVFDMWRLSRSILESEEANSFFHHQDAESLAKKLKGNEGFPFKNRIEDFLAKYCYHSLRELDISIPCWGEDPSQPLNLLFDMLGQDQEQDPVKHNKHQHLLYLKAIKDIHSPGIRGKLEQFRALLWEREYMRDYSTRMYFIIRHVTLEIGRRLKEREIINDAQNIYFLSFQDLLSLFAEQSHPGIFIEKIERNKIIYQSFRNFKKPNEIGLSSAVSPFLKNLNGNSLKGIACSPGYVKGRAVVVKDIYKSDEINSGDILVTYFTDPAWTPVFSKISGLITETGGMLSHGAVVSREYGIPAVLAVIGAIEKIKTGMELCVDGYNGIVSINSGVNNYKQAINLNEAVGNHHDQLNYSSRHPNSDSTENLQIWDNTNIRESYPGQSCPLTYSFVRKTYEIGYLQLAEILGVKKSLLSGNIDSFTTMVGYIEGRIYYNLSSWYKLLALLPGQGYTSRMLDKMIGAESIKLRKEKHLKPFEFLRILSLLTKITWQLFRLPARTRHFESYLKKRLEYFNRLQLDEISSGQLVVLYETMEEEVIKNWKTPVLNGFLAMILHGLLQVLLRKWYSGEQQNLHNDLLCGQGNIISARVVYDLIVLAEKINESPEAKSFFTDTEVSSLECIRQKGFIEIYDALNEYLNKYGVRCAGGELKLETRTYLDEPQGLIKLIKIYINSGLKMPDTGNDNAIRRNAEIELSKVLKKKILKRLVINLVLARTRLLVANRENLRFERTKAFGIARKFFLGFGRKLQQAGIITNERDIFFLTKDEIFDYLRGLSVNRNLMQLIELRKRWYRDQASANPHQRIVTNRIVYCDLDNPVPSQKIDGLMILHGTGCCPGKVTGKIRIVSSPESLESMGNDILVAASTDPDWVKLFPTASGILQETGGLLSHTSIVCREMGIPSIVGIPGLINNLREGDMVEMDGSQGIVRILNRAFL